MYSDVNHVNRYSQQLKQTLLKEFGYSPNLNAKECSVITHTDISGGAQIRGETQRRKGNYNCRNREHVFYQYLEDGMKKGGDAYINELAPTEVRTLFIDLDLVVAKDNTKGAMFLKEAVYVELVKKVVFPIVDAFFPQEGWRQNHPHLKFAVACPDQLREKKGGQKFGAHIRAMQIKDNYVSRSIFLHVDNMLRMRRMLIYKLEEEYPEGTYGIDWEDAVDKAPMKNGGMRMIGMKKYKVRCPCLEPSECEKCDFGTKHFYDPSKYKMVAVVNHDGTIDKEHLKRLQDDKKQMWMETSISSPFTTQKEANHNHMYTADGIQYKGDIPEATHARLSQEDVDGLEHYNSTTDDGVPIVLTTKKKRKVKLSGREKQERSKRMKNTEEIADPKLKKDLTAYIRNNFKQYREKINVSKVVRVDAGNYQSPVLVYLSGANAGICQNRVGGGSHADNTYLQITATKGAQQRCFSENDTKEKCRNGSCRKFYSKAQKLPVDIQTYLFPSVGSSLRPSTTTNGRKISDFEKTLMKRMNRHMGYTKMKNIDALLPS